MEVIGNLLEVLTAQQSLLQAETAQAQDIFRHSEQFTYVIE